MGSIRQYGTSSLQMNHLTAAGVAFRGLVPIKELESWRPLESYSASWLGKDKNFLVFPISQNKTLNVVAFDSINGEDLGSLKESWSATGQLSEVIEHFADFDEPV